MVASHGPSRSWRPDANAAIRSDPVGPSPPAGHCRAGSFSETMVEESHTTVSIVYGSLTQV